MTFARVAFFVTVCAVCMGTAPARGKEEPFKNFVLRNGMKIVLKENHDNPLIASLVYVNAGSAFEERWNNGSSHLLEHLLFDGTARRSREDINEGVKDLGGYINAFTRELYTAFILLVPAENIKDGLSLQEDMLFHSLIPEEELEKERKVVIEEIRKDDANPSSPAETFHREKVFSGTPYALPVIGLPNVISTVTRQEVLDYYTSYYIPNNMMVLVIGDFQEDAMLALLEDTFGGVPARPLPNSPTLAAEPPTESVLLARHGDTSVPRMSVSFFCPPAYHRDYPALLLASRYLAQDEDSPLVRSLVRGNEPVAVSVWTDLILKHDFSVLDVSIMLGDKAPEEVLKKLGGAIKQVAHIRPEKERIDELKTQAVVNDMITEEKFHYFGIMMADEIVIGGVDNLANRRKAIEEVTPEDISRVASQYLDGASFVATAFLPGVEEGVNDEKGEQRQVLRKTLPNGLTLIVESSSGSAVFAMNVFAKGRVALEPPGKEGISDFLSRMLLRGTSARSSEVLAKELRSIGAEVTVVDNPMIPYDDIYTTPAYSFVRFQTISSFQEKALSLLSDMIRNPSFEESEIALVREELQGVIAQAGRSSEQEGRAALREAMFPNHPFSRRILGSAETLSAITREDLIAHHAALYSPANLIVSVVTDLPANAVSGAVENAFGGSWGAGTAFGGYPPPAHARGNNTSTREIGSKQAYLYFGYSIPGAGDSRVPDIIAMNSVLSARLGLNLREKEGLAYSVGSSAHFDRDFGYLVISMGTAAESIERAKELIVGEVNRLVREGIETRELERAVSDFRGDLLRKRMSRLNKAYYIARDEYLGWGDEDGIFERMSALGVEDVKKAAAVCLTSDDCALVIVK
jgi:predicted Zn-dependent peptidase